MSAPQLVRDLSQRREEHGIGQCPVSRGRVGIVDQLTEPCLLQAGCPFLLGASGSCRTVCWYAVRER